MMVASMVATTLLSAAANGKGVRCTDCQHLAEIHSESKLKRLQQTTESRLNIWVPLPIAGQLEQPRQLSQRHQQSPHRSGQYASYAFTYPSLSTDSNLEVGISLGWGGRSFYDNNAVGILGDFVVWYPKLSTISNSSRYGDYFNVARNTPKSALFDASGYAVLKNIPPAVGQQFDPYYIQFGRNSIVNGGVPNSK